MKKLFYFLVLVIAFAACDNNRNRKLPGRNQAESAAAAQEKTNAVSSSNLGKLKSFDLDKFQEAPSKSGLMMRPLVAGNGVRVRKGDLALSRYAVYYADNMEKLETSDDFNNGKPFDMQVGQGMLVPGLEEGFLYLREGDRYLFYIPPHLGFVNGREGVDGSRALLYDIEVIRTRAGSQPFDISGVNKQVASSGLEFYIVERTMGAPVQAGQTVTVHYSGYFKDGRKFDSSVDRGQPFTFRLGRAEVMAGWEEAVQHLKVGEKARFIIPSKFAYGEKGMANIPPNTDLVFDIEIIAAQ